MHVLYCHCRTIADASMKSCVTPRRNNERKKDYGQSPFSQKNAAKPTRSALNPEVLTFPSFASRTISALTLPLPLLHHIRPSSGPTQEAVIFDAMKLTGAGTTA